MIEWTTSCQLIWKFIWNGQISRKMKLTKTDSKRNRTHEKSSNHLQNWHVVKDLKKKTQGLRLFYPGAQLNIQGTNNFNFMVTIPK